MEHGNGMIKHAFMTSIEDFKTYMRRSENYVRRYCMDLDEDPDPQKWNWFYGQMLDVMSYVSDVDRFFYNLKWILKENLTDLTYSALVQDIMDPEGGANMFDEETTELLSQKYEKELEDFFEIFKPTAEELWRLEEWGSSDY